MFERKMERDVSCLELKNIVGTQTCNSYMSRRNTHGPTAQGRYRGKATSDACLGSQKPPPKCSKRMTAGDRQRMAGDRQRLTVTKEPTKSLNGVDNYVCQHLEVGSVRGDHDVRRGPQGRQLAPNTWS